MPIKVTLDLNYSRIRKKITNDNFGLLVSNEWKRLIDPYTPRDTGVMEETAKVSPWQIHYLPKYSSIVYYGYDLNFQNKNPYSTFEWDINAEYAGQKSKLYRTLNSALKSGRI